MQKVNYNHYNSIRIKNLEFAKVEKGKVYYLYADINSYMVLNIVNDSVDGFMFSVGDYYTVGKNLDELDTFLNGVSYVLCGDTLELDGMTKYIPVYVDDLTYYYYFFKKHFNIDLVYSLKGSVAYFRYLNFEFRCLGVLSDLEFETEFSEEYVEFQKKYLEGFTHFSNEYNYANMPLTQIKFVKRKLMSYKIGTKSSYDLITMTPEEYQTVSHCWSGGLCAYNKKYVNKPLRCISLFDFSSAYPSVMCKYDLFPVKFVSFTLKLEKDEYLEKIKSYCVYGKVHLKNLRRKENCPGIKTDLIYGYSLDYPGNINVIEDLDTKEINSASLICLYLTEIDYLTLQQFYDFELVGATDVYIYERGMLPKSLRDCVLYFFKLKDNSKKGTIQYILAKKALNSIFGLNFIDPVKTYKEVEDTNNPFEKKLRKGLNELIFDYNEKQNSGKSYTSYQWGLYICAIQRLELSKFIRKAIDLDIWVYSDTDSLYVIRKKGKIQEFINYVNEWNKKHYSYINYLLKTKNCKLGILEKEKFIERFKVLGKKQYFYTEGESIVATMSGISKTRVSNYLNELNKNVDVFKEIKRGSTLKGMQKRYHETEDGVYVEYLDIKLGG